MVAHEINAWACLHGLKPKGPDSQLNFFIVCVLLAYAHEGPMSPSLFKILILFSSLLYIQADLVTKISVNRVL